MNDSDSVVYSVPFLFRASRNRSIRETWLLGAQMVAEVFTKSGVATLDLVARFQDSPETFEVHHADLLPDSDAFSRIEFHRVFEQWLGRSPSLSTEPTSEKLVASLTKQIDDYRRTEV